MTDALKLFVDADAFVAFTVITDANHKRAVSLLNSLTERPVFFLTSNYVFAESITIISQRASHQTAVKYIEEMQLPASPFQIKRAEESIEQEAIKVFKEQTSKNTSCVDCTNMVFMKRLALNAIFSFDRTYRKNGFTIVEDLLATEPQAA
jgi:predicted nucleic acid-binding protein